MAYRHFAREEAKKLLDYLDTGRTEKLVKTLRDNADIRDSVPMISSIDQGNARVRDYEKTSSFGRNRAQIRRNARAHLRECTYCHAEYEIAVKKLACTVARIRIKTGLFSIDRINELLEEDIKRKDVLGILQPKRQ